VHIITVKKQRAKYSSADIPRSSGGIGAPECLEIEPASIVSDVGELVLVRDGGKTFRLRLGKQFSRTHIR
jgi:hypothetical protein